MKLRVYHGLVFWLRESEFRYHGVICLFMGMREKKKNSCLTQVVQYTKTPVSPHTPVLCVRNRSKIKAD